MHAHTAEAKDGHEKKGCSRPAYEWYHGVVTACCCFGRFLVILIVVHVLRGGTFSIKALSEKV